MTRFDHLSDAVGVHREPGRHTIASLVAVSWVVDAYFSNPIIPGRFPPLVKMLVDEMVDGAMTRELLSDLDWADDPHVSESIPRHYPIECKTLGDFLSQPSGFSWGITSKRVNVGDSHVLQEVVDSTWADVVRHKSTRLVLNRLLRIAHDGLHEAPEHVAQFLSSLGSDDRVFYFVRDACYPAASPNHNFRAENAMIDCISPFDTLLSIRYFRPGYQIEPRPNKDGRPPVPELSDLAEPLNSLPAVAHLAVDAEGLRFISALANDHALLRRLSDIKVDSQVRRLGASIQKWLRQIPSDPRYDSLLGKLYLALDTPHFTRGTQSYVAMFSPHMPTLGFSSYNWAFFMAHALSGEYECHDRPVHVLFRKTAPQPSSGSAYGTVFGLTIHGSQVTDLDSDAIIAIGQRDTRLSTVHFAHRNMEFVSAAELVPHFFSGLLPPTS